jgi:hypothetical protein
MFNFPHLDTRRGNFRDDGWNFSFMVSQLMFRNTAAAATAVAWGRENGNKGNS